jgi:UDP-galactopyranose mutase
LVVSNTTANIYVDINYLEVILMLYDFLIVGAGLFGSVFAHEAALKGKRCLVIDKRSHIGGNIFTKNIEGIEVHKYGAHIFHTNDKVIWDYVNQFSTFNNFINMPLANYRGNFFNLPFNMYTFNQLWGIESIDAAKKKLQIETEPYCETEPKNLAEQAKKLVGNEIYHKLIKGYTEKQWGRTGEELPAFIIKRLPVRFEYNNNYFNDHYQGIPINGYTKMIEKMLSNAEIRLNENFIENKDKYMNISKTIIYTGMIDEFFDYKYGPLEYRSLSFKEKMVNNGPIQETAVINYTDKRVPYTRTIEHQHFEFLENRKSIITFEFPKEWCKGAEPFYPINDERNNVLYNKYR